MKSPVHLYKSKSDGWIINRGDENKSLDISLSQLLQMNIEDARQHISKASKEVSPIAHRDHLAPIDDTQEVWACGVTYLRSKVGRMEESDLPDLYSRVYDALRPEIFFKSSGWRAVGNKEAVGIRADSGWDVPEGEVGLVVNAHGEIFGYVIGNDMSSRSIEGENALYLPQAKCYEKSCALGPYIVPAWEIGEAVFPIKVSITRDGSEVFSGESSSGQMKRNFPELVEWLFKTLPMPEGAIVLTGTGVVPDSSFTLHVGDVVDISIQPLGTLSNHVVSVGSK
jgi:2-dehydro-3-deoxy-D-arabinonate dehydratase